MHFILSFQLVRTTSVMSSTSSLIRPGLTTPVSSQLAQIKLRLRKKVPLLSGKDVRRERIPYYEAISSELYERGYTDAAFLVLDLIEFEDRHVWPTSEPPVEERRLRHSRKLLDYLLSSLGRAQQYKYDGLYERETEELLGTARKFERDAEKRWLARQFYLIALERSGDVPPTIRPKVQAKVRYYYAKLLLQLRKPVKAMQQLEDADNALMLAHLKGYPVGQTLEENRAERLEVAINTVLFEVHAQMAKDCRRSPVWMQGQYIRGAHQAALKSKQLEELRHYTERVLNSLAFFASSSEGVHFGRILHCVRRLYGRSSAGLSGSTDTIQNGDTAGRAGW